MRYFVIFCIGFLAFYSHLFAQEWSDPSIISGGNKIDNPDFCIDNSGVIHCVWTHEVEENFKKIYYSKSSDDGNTWSTPTDVVQNESLWLDNASIACDSNDDIYICYDHDNANPYATIVLLTKLINNTWSTPDTVSEGLYSSYHNRIIFDNDDRLYVFWHRPESIYYRYYYSNAWSNIIIPYDDDNFIGLADVKADTNNNLHCIGSFHYLGQNHYNDRAVYFSYDLFNSQWSEIEVLSDSTTWWGLKLDLDNNHFPRTTWGQYTSLDYPPKKGTYYSEFNGNNWSQPILLNENLPNNQVIAIDRNNITHICNREDFNDTVNEEIISTLTHYFYSDGVWYNNIVDQSDFNIGDLNIKYYDGNLYLIYKKIIDGESVSNLIIKTYEVAVGVTNIIKNSSMISCFPNPFTAKTRFSFSLEKAADITLQMYNQQGQLVDIIEKQNLANGEHQIEWQCGNNPKVPLGVYMASLFVDGVREGSVKVVKVE